MEEEQDELGPKTVFTIKHSDIPKGITQCSMGKHLFKKKNENEVYCPACGTCLIVNPETLNELIKK